MRDVSQDMEQIAAARWQEHTVDRALRGLALLGLAAAVVLVLAYMAPYAEELLDGAVDG